MIPSAPFGQAAAAGARPGSGRERAFDCDVAIVGAGPAGLAAAAGAAAEGAESILLIDRDYGTGGILNQCIHDGFGLVRYREVLTGPEYAARERERTAKAEAEGRISILTDTFVHSLVPDKLEGGFLLGLMCAGSCRRIRARTAILATGCRERTAGAINLPGRRPAGIYTAGTVQRLMNRQNISVGSRAVIIGSGDIGLIMARRLTLEGTTVAAVVEIAAFPGGLDRNVRQCLHDFSIPLYLSTEVIAVHGSRRLEAVTIAPLAPEKNRTPGPSGLTIPCDTLLISAGLIPEHELLREAGAEIDPATRGPTVDQYGMTTIPGLYACGNLQQVHDLVDYASQDAELTGRAACRYARSLSDVSRETIPLAVWPVTAGSLIRYAAPQRIAQLPESGGPVGSSPVKQPVTISLRVSEPHAHLVVRVMRSDDLGGRPLASRNIRWAAPSEMIRIRVPDPPHAALTVSAEVVSNPTGGEQCLSGSGTESGNEIRELVCILCPKGCRITAETASGTGAGTGSGEPDILAISGAACPKGSVWVRKELLHPERIVCSSILAAGGEEPLAGVKTDRAVPLSAVGYVMEHIRRCRAAAPVREGDVVLTIADTRSAQAGNGEQELCRVVVTRSVRRADGNSGGGRDQ